MTFFEELADGSLFGTKYSRVDQAKFVGDNF